MINNLEINNLEEFKAKLRTCGMKVTPQRLAIFKALVQSHEHPAAESLLKVVKQECPEISHATVYSTLRALQQKGIVAEIGTTGDIRRFDAQPDPHPHLICLKCNKIEDVDLSKTGGLSHITEIVAKKTHYQLIKFRWSFYGYCPDCQSTTS